MDDDDETLTAYHEAGHAVIAYALGGHVEAVSLGGEWDEDQPRRFGDCRVNWGPIDASCDWQRQRELMTILAGPVAEMIYRGEPLHPARFGPWQDDWQRAWISSEPLVPNPARRTWLLEQLIAELHRRMRCDLCWAAVAALADDLVAHETLEGDQVAETVGFWLRRDV